MFENLKDILETFDKIYTKSKGTKKSAAPANLFTVQEYCKHINKELSEQFHSIIAQVLFNTKLARPDTGTSVSFLTTRVRAPDQDDWLKLPHLMMYIRGTIYLPLTLSANGTIMLKWYVYGFYGVNPNMRGHSGGLLSIGTGLPISSSTKKKLNTRSSTESDIVGVDEFMLSILWTRNFLNAQDYDVMEKNIFQDNKSAILLEKNGRSSSGNREKHINIR